MCESNLLGRGSKGQLGGELGMWDQEGKEGKQGCGIKQSSWRITVAHSRMGALETVQVTPLRVVGARGLQH